MEAQHQFKVIKLKKNQQMFRNQDKLFKTHKTKWFRKIIKIRKLDARRQQKTTRPLKV